MTVHQSAQPISNILIQLHGLGDNSQNFSKFGHSLNLPQTLVISLQGPVPIPFLDGYSWYNSFDTMGNVLGYDGSREGIQVLANSVDKFKIEYPPERIFLVGYGQGAEIIDLYLRESKRTFGGAVSICGKGLSHQTPSLNLKEMPRSKEEGRVLIEFFAKRLWLRNLELEKIADRVVGLERM